MKKEVIKEAAEKANGYAHYGKPLGGKYLAFNEGFIEGAKWQAEEMISKEAYEDNLNMQKTSNVGYESKIKEMYSEEDVRKMLWGLGDVLFNNNQNGIK